MMRDNLGCRLVFCALAVSCIAHSAYSLPAHSKKEDVAKSEAEAVKLEDDHHVEAPLADITNELEKMLVSMKKREAKEKEAARESQAVPTNVVLIMSRDPLAFGQNGTEQKRSSFSLFPVKHYVQDKEKRSPDEPLLLVSPKLLPRKGTYDSTHSCQAALDDAVSDLLGSARTKRQMVTGFLASENLSFGDPLTSFGQKQSTGDTSDTEREPSSGSRKARKHSIAKRSAEKEDDADKKMEEGSALIAPINDKFQKIGIEDKGTGILYKKVEIVGGSKKSDEMPIKEGAEHVKEKVVKREVGSGKEGVEPKGEESSHKGDKSNHKWTESSHRDVESNKKWAEFHKKGEVNVKNMEKSGKEGAEAEKKGVEPHKKVEKFGKEEEDDEKNRVESDKKVEKFGKVEANSDNTRVESHKKWAESNKKDDSKKVENSGEEGADADKNGMKSHTKEEKSGKEEEDDEKNRVVVDKKVDKFGKEGAEADKNEVESGKKIAMSGKEGTEADKNGIESHKPISSLGNDKAEKKLGTDGASEPPSWDLFDAINRMRRTFFDRLFRGMGFDVGQNEDSAMGSPLVGLVDSTLTDLQREGETPGFLLVVSGGDANETEEVVKLVRRKTNPVDTLIVVTGMCPEQDGKDKNSNFWQFDPSNQMVFSSQEQRLLPAKQKEVNRIPVYASGPGSEVLNNIDTLWNVPVAIKNVTVDEALGKTNSTAKNDKDQYYGYKSEDKKLPGVKPDEFVSINNEASTDKAKEKTKTKGSRQSDEGFRTSYEMFPSKHREVRSTDWGRLSAQHVREKMSAAESMYGGVGGGDEGGEAPVPPSWFDDDYNNDVKHDEMVALAQQNKKEAEVKEQEVQEKEGEMEERKDDGVKQIADAADAGEHVRACVLATCAMFATIRLF